MRFSDSNNFARNVCGLPPSYHADMAVIDANRPDKGEFYHDTKYDGLPISLLMERDSDGFHLRQIWSMEGDELNWVPRHIAGLMKEQAITEIQKENAFSEPDGSGV